jgi:hypothetical protein
MLIVENDYEIAAFSTSKVAGSNTSHNSNQTGGLGPGAHST